MRLLRAPQGLNNLEYPRLDSPGTSTCCAARSDCTWKHGSSLGDLPSAAIDPRRAGAMLSDLAPGQHPGDLPGVALTQVTSRSRAVVSGLHPGDVIVGVNQRRVEDVAGLRAVPPCQLLLPVVRDRRGFYIMAE